MCGHVEATPRPRRSIRVLGHTLVALLIAQVVAVLLTVWAKVLETSLLQRVIDGEQVTQAEALASDDRVNTAAGFSVLLLVATGVVWLIWQYRAQTNLKAFGATELAYSPAWSVGWWLIPIANLWKPFQVNRELWKKSGGDDVGPSSSRTWSVLGWWWGSWILWIVLSQISRRSVDAAEDAMALRNANLFFFLSAAALVASAVLAMLLVRSVGSRQARLAVVVADRDRPPPTPARPDRSA